MNKEPFETMPDVMDAKQLAQALHLSKAGAYNFLSNPDFPTLQISGRKLVMKQDLIVWPKSKTNTKTEKLYRMDADRLLTKQAVFFYPIFQKAPQRLSGVTESKILPRCQISLFAHFPLGPLVGECLPQILL